MFHISNNNIITLNRGDTIDYSFKVDFGSKILHDYKTLAELNGTLYFAVMEPSQPFEFALIRKTFTSEDEDADGVKIHLDSMMTQRLLPGTYYYTIKLVYPNESEEDIVETLVPNTKFAICE